MAEVRKIIGTLATSSAILHSFASQVTSWKLLSDELLDLRINLDAAELSLRDWKRKYDIQERWPPAYSYVLFGRLGWQHIQETLESIKNVATTVNKEVHAIIGQAKPFHPHEVSQEQIVADYDVHLIRECIRRIESRPSWRIMFKFAVFSKANDLRNELDRLDVKLTYLERYSEWCVEREHPEVFACVKRLPGRREILRFGDRRSESIQHRILDSHATRKDADLLHKATGQHDSCRIGISVPQIHKRDFAFLLTVRGRTHEIHVRPVKFKAVADRSVLQTDISSTIPALVERPQEPCNMLPHLVPLSTGFQVSVPPSNILTHLELKDALKTLLTDKHKYICQQVLYPQDQAAIACGLVHGTFRLLGSQWLQFLDCQNIRWCRNVDNHWTIMMTALPGAASTTLAIEEVMRAHGQLQLTKHCQIFRLGLLLVELALKTTISHIAFDTSSGGAKVYMSGLDHRALSAAELAAEVDTRTNRLYANMVFFCLSVLQDKDLMRNPNIDASFYKDVLSQVEELDALVEADRRLLAGAEAR